MNYWQASLLISSILLDFSSCQSNALNPPPIVLSSTQVCSDFWEKWGDKPATVKFIRCEKVKHPQVDTLVSSYIVTGAEAAAVEKMLQKKFGMAPLGLVCCIWEPSTVMSRSGSKYGHYVDENGFEFEISMFSGETPINSRDDWSKIPEFHIRVKTYLGEV